MSGVCAFCGYGKNVVSPLARRTMSDDIFDVGVLIVGDVAKNTEDGEARQHRRRRVDYTDD